MQCSAVYQAARITVVNRKKALTPNTYGGDFCCGMADVVPFVRGKDGVKHPELYLWGKPTGKYFVHYSVEWTMVDLARFVVERIRSIKSSS